MNQAIIWELLNELRYLYVGKMYPEFKTEHGKAAFTEYAEW